MSTSAPFRFTCITLCFVILPAVALATSEPNATTLTRSILHILDYLAVDYPHTVQNGAITDAAEYDEQREFAERLQTLMPRLPDNSSKTALEQRAAALMVAIEQRASGEQVRGLCTELSSALIAAYKVPIAPAHSPALDQAPRLFQSNCASCHGQEGLGNGPAAAALRPRPSNFHDRDRQSQRSVYSLYSTITLGVAGTAMPSFAHLRDDDRWSLAFYVSHFLTTNAERQRGKELWQQGFHREWFADLGRLTQATPAAIAAQHGKNAADVLAYLRSAPDRVSPDKSSPLAFSGIKLAESLEAYRAGAQTHAYELAVAAYLEGFELAEAGLGAADPELKQVIETKMGQYRQAVKQRLPETELAAQVAELQQLLDQAKDRLNSTALAPAMSFAGAFIILIREGLEAILVLAAIAAFLSKTQRRDALRYMHAGWLGALAVGMLTWMVAKYLIRFSGANRELTEGFTALFAAAMLVYVGCWLHNYANSQRWHSFIHGKVQQTLSSGTVWSLALVSFVVVYREVMETVLFYETLWLQTVPAGHSYIVSGFAMAALALVVLAWVIFRFSIRLPLRLFFQVNAVLLLVLAVVFAGKGVAALQEAGRLPVNPIHIPTIDVLGIYPTLESLGLQLMLVCVTLGWFAYQHRQGRIA